MRYGGLLVLVIEGCVVGKSSTGTEEDCEWSTCYK